MRAWSVAAEDKLRRLYPMTGLTTLAFQLKRTPVAIKQRAVILGLRKANGPRAWSRAEDAQLRRRYPNEATADIARDLGRTLSTTYQRALKLGLKKAEGWVAKCMRERWAQGRHVNSRKAQFKPGVPSWSKGTKGIVGVQEGCRRTQFKKGTMAGAAQHNYVPIGTERVRDGYLCRKLTDDPNTYPANRWKALHRIVWEEANGPVPPGFAVTFKPGRHTTDAALITPDAVELVSRAELMRRNSYHTRYPELAPLIQLRGALNRKLNRRAQRQDASA
jgi:hypothetical protein